jgi:DNA-binding NarL/FixJ family response regulator
VLAVVTGASGESLTPSARRVFLGICRGLRNKEIGAELGISERTVKWHVTELLKKLGGRNRAHLRARADDLLADETWKRIGKPEAGASSTSPGARG